MATTWNREDSWALALPREEVAAVLGLARRILDPLDGEYRGTWHMADLVSPSAKIDINDDLGAFLRELAEFPDGAIGNLSMYARVGNTSFDVRVSVGILVYYEENARTRLHVHGSDRTAVEGVFVQIQESVAKRVDAEQRRSPSEREARELARRQLQEPSPVNTQEAPEPLTVAVPPPPQPEEAAPASPSVAPSRATWWHNPWIVTIVGTVIAGVILALILGS